MWDWFWKLSGRRGIGESGAQQPLESCRDWDFILGSELRQPEIDMILAMDSAFIKSSNDEYRSLRELEKAKKDSQPKAKRFGK